MTYKLFLDTSCGLDFVLKKKLEREGIVVPNLPFKDNREDYIKNNIKTTPVLFKFDTDGNCDIIKGVDDIFEELKKGRDYYAQDA